MGSRAYIAKIERDGTGRMIYLGHGCYPDEAGRVLLESYSEQGRIEALIGRGATARLESTIQESVFYHTEYGQRWEDCQPSRFRHGTEGFFGRAYQPGPEWLYAWTPDGWFGAKVKADLPTNYINKLGVMDPGEFQDWFDHNGEPEWVEWRTGGREEQRPRPLADIIGEYAKLGPGKDEERE